MSPKGYIAAGGRVRALFLVSLAALLGLISGCNPTSTPNEKSGPDQITKKLAKVQQNIDQTNRRLTGEDVDVTTDELNGKKTYTVQLLAAKGSGTLVIRCVSAKDFDIYFAVDAMVDSSGHGNSSVRYKFDDRAPKQEWWWEAKDYLACRLTEVGFGLPSSRGVGSRRQAKRAGCRD